MRKLIFSIFLCSTYVTSHAFDFKGVAVGEKSSKQQVLEKTGVECGSGLAGALVCNGDVSLAREHASMNLYLSADSTVQRIMFSLPSRSYDDVSEALIAKFGTPTDTKRSKMVNGYGAAFEQVEHHWNDKAGNVMTFTKYGYRISDSSLIMMTPEELSRWSKPLSSRKDDL